MAMEEEGTQSTNKDGSETRSAVSCLIFTDARRMHPGGNKSYYSQLWVLEPWIKRPRWV